MSCAKTAEPIEMPFRTWVGPKTCIRWGPDPPWEGAIMRGKGDLVTYIGICHELCKNN